MSEGLLHRLWERTWRVARAAAEAVLIPAGLFFLYFVVLGLTAVIARLLRAGIMKDAGSWSAAEGCEPDAEDLSRQS